MASWWFAKADSEINFNNTSYNEKHTLDFTAPASGDYLILVSFAAMCDDYKDAIFWRAQLDDTTTIMEGQTEGYSNDRTYTYRTFHSVYLAENLSSGSHYVDIDAYIAASNELGYMRYMKIAVLRLDDWLPTSGMYDYASVEGELTLSQSWQTAATLTFTPDQAGDYLLLGSCEVKTGSTSRHTSVRLNYDSGSEYLPVLNSEESGDVYCSFEARDTADYLSWVWGGIVNIPASSKTTLLEAVCTSTSSTGKVRRRRILAIRIGAMDSGANTDEDPANTSTTAQWTDKSVITFTPSSTEDYFLLSGMVIKPDTAQASYSGHTRLEQTAGTDSGTISQANVLSKDAVIDCFPFFTTEIKSLGAISQTFKTQWGYIYQSSTQYGKGSFIIAIRKPAAVGWQHDVNGVANANIDEISGVALENIAEVNGV